MLFSFDGEHYSISFTSGPKGRVSISGSTPFGYPSPNMERPEITVSLTRAAGVIADDFKRRLVPAARVYLAEARDMKAKADDIEARTQATLTELCRRLGETPRKDGDTFRRSVFHNGIHFEVRGPDTVTVTYSPYLTLDQATAFAKMFDAKGGES